MATRTVALSVVLVMSLIMAHTQVDARICCTTIKARNQFNACRFAGGRESYCVKFSGCKAVNEGACPPGYSNDILENSAADAIKEYCNLGCVYYSCGALTTLQNSDPNTIVNGAVEQCTKACSTFCTNASMTAVQTA